MILDLEATDQLVLILSVNLKFVMFDPGCLCGCVYDI